MNVTLASPSGLTRDILSLGHKTRTKLRFEPPNQPSWLNGRTRKRLSATIGYPHKKKPPCGGLFIWRPQGDSNPCCRRERDRTRQCCTTLEALSICFILTYSIAVCYCPYKQAIVGFRKVSEEMELKHG